MSGVFKACVSGVGQPPTATATATATATEGSTVAATRVTVVAEPSIRDGKSYELCCFFFYLM
jgi:hypothetical protein